jgi:hypothetical protein
MPAHWLYRLFEETWQNDLQHTLDAHRLYNSVASYGFDVKLERHTYYQPVALEAAWELAQQQERVPQLANLPDAVYEMRRDALQHRVELVGEETLLPSEYCLVQMTAVKGEAR